MSNWQRAGALDDIQEEAPHAVEIGGKAIALYRFGDEVCAVGDTCPHQGDVKLSEGYFEGDTIECPMHQSCFNVRTGKVLGPPARDDLPVYPVRIEDGQVLVDTEG
ncbi:non-heme iron oxygenase ferredoxin subunit [Xenophilus azovorans]|uniref:non-heme iron oxygenase ferredoxin subunit n=1 Tax=Xenophilus azovorans TaxID=151755 RepID=UPI000571E927|nr:non-heme iron oxygenase ferredoxin subunit [Xenophilus azovorans]